MQPSNQSSESHNAPFAESVRARVAQIRITKSIYEAASCHGPVALAGGVLRPLNNSEVIALSHSNKCSDWSALRIWMDKDVMGTDDNSAWLEEHVTYNVFEGIIVISIAHSSAEPLTPSTSSSPAPGIHHNTLIANCIFEPNCRVYRNALLRNTHVGRDAVVLHNGQVNASSQAYGAISISVGPETGGGRKLTVIAESTMLNVCQIAGMGRRTGVGTVPIIPTAATETCIWNTFGNACIVRDTPTISNVYMAPDSKIEAATLVNHAVLLPTAEISHGATANHVLLQWKASIAHQSNVSHTLLMECASAGPMSTVAESVLGPDVHVSAGEIHASIMGPNTNAHHQSLLIGVVWPLGRGNVGYGANVGSNHTGRLPDQECLSGEGTFWGLSTVVKFPVSMAPYALVAAGTTVAPQRIELPFSLLVEQSIMPGWLLSHSPYTLSRSEAKFATRRTAQRHAFYTGWKIVRPAMIDVCLAARRALQSVTQIQDVYHTERAVPGIGQMQLTEKARQAGIIAYTSCVRRYALSGLLEYYIQGGTSLELDLASCGTLAQEDLTSAHWPALPWEEEDTWSHQKMVLAQEFPRSDAFSSWITDCLRELVQLEKDYAERVYSSKQRDDERGARTIPSYTEVHIEADVDDVVLAARARAIDVEREVAKVLMQLSHGVQATQSKL